jgi:DNA-binding transcriptional regulator YdaS (Cro superfamily)
VQEAVDSITAGVVTTHPVMKESASLVALKAAIDRAGSQSALARVLSISQQAVSGWVKRGSELPPQYVLAVEAATGISRHDLRPDIYPIEMPDEHAGGSSAAASLPPAAAGVQDPVQGLQS